MALLSDGVDDREIESVDGGEGVDWGEDEAVGLTYSSKPILLSQCAAWILIT